MTSMGETAESLSWLHNRATVWVSTGDAKDLVTTRQPRSLTPRHHQGWGPLPDGKSYTSSAATESFSDTLVSYIFLFFYETSGFHAAATEARTLSIRSIGYTQPTVDCRVNDLNWSVLMMCAPRDLAVGVTVLGEIHKIRHMEQVDRDKKLRSLCRFP